MDAYCYRCDSNRWIWPGLLADGAAFGIAAWEASKALGILP